MVSDHDAVDVATQDRAIPDAGVRPSFTSPNTCAPRAINAFAQPRLFAEKTRAVVNLPMRWFYPFAGFENKKQTNGAANSTPTAAS